MHTSHVHIAGVGISGEEGATLNDLAVSAGTKALLDAGLTYTDIDHSFAATFDEQRRIPRGSFSAFGSEGIVSEVDNASAVFLGSQYIKSREGDCVLIIGLDEVELPAKIDATGDLYGVPASLGRNAHTPVAVAIVLVSDKSLTARAFLKDGGIRIAACTMANRIHARPSGGADGARPVRSALLTALRQARLEPEDIHLVETRSGNEPDARRSLDNGVSTASSSKSVPSESRTGTSGLAGLCSLVWRLRGWASCPSSSPLINCLQYTPSQDEVASVIILRRSDGRPAPSWSEIENVRDGRERLGYNPAVETRSIALEDLEAVRSRAEVAAGKSQVRTHLPVKGGDRAALARL